MSTKRVTGPIQVFVIGFDKFKETGKILAELKRARKRGVIRLVDLLFVQKDKQGNVSNSMHMTDLSEFERRRLGAVAGGLLAQSLGLHAVFVIMAAVSLAMLGGLTIVTDARMDAAERDADAQPAT